MLITNLVLPYLGVCVDSAFVAWCSKRLGSVLNPCSKVHNSDLVTVYLVHDFGCPTVLSHACSGLRRTFRILLRQI
jgi:hypothetical protein